MSDSDTPIESKDIKYTPEITIAILLNIVESEQETLINTYFGIAKKIVTSFKW